MSRKFKVPLNIVGLASNPASAVDGDIYFNTDEKIVKIYSDNTWQDIGLHAGTAVVSTILPTTAIEGQLWFDNDDGKFYIYDGAYWVEAAVGPQGEPGAGIAVGGNQNDFLKKSSANNYETEWVSLPSSSLTSTDISRLTGATSNLQTQINNISTDLTNLSEDVVYSSTIGQSNGVAPLNASTKLSNSYIPTNLNVDGTLTVAGVPYIGNGATAFADPLGAHLTNPVIVARFDNGQQDISYAQIAYQNADPTSSTDIIVYMDNGNDDSGWMGIGITGSQFGDNNYGITGSGDGYILHDTLNDTYNGNLVIATGNSGAQNKIVFAAGGYASGNTQMVIVPDEKVQIDIAGDATSSITGALQVSGGAGFNGKVYGSNDLKIEGVMYGGPGSRTFGATITNPMAVFTLQSGATASYNQFAIKGQDPTSSTDLIVYADNGEDLDGWIDMGITGSEFDQANFGITGPNDGYIFFEAPEGTTGAGNLVLATGGEGTLNKIIFAAGGFYSGRSQMEITPDDNVKINITTESTSPTTGALQVIGGAGILGNMNVQGNVNVQGTITFGGSGTTVTTSNLSVTDPFISVGNGNQTDIIDLGLIIEHTIPVTAIVKTITNKSLTSNIATLTTGSAHTYRAGDVVVISGVDSTFNGTYSIIDVPTTTTFTYSKTASNVSSVSVSPAGSASVSNRRVFGGITRDASDNVFKFFKDLVIKPTSSVDFSEVGIGYSDIKVNNIEANSINIVSATIGDVSNTEIQYLDGVTSSIQTQLNSKITASSLDTLTNKTIGSSGLLFNNGGNSSSVYAGGNDLSVYANNTLYLNGNAEVVIQPGIGYDASVRGDVITTLNAGQTLTNKTISGSSNTLTNIPNSALSNYSITINGSAVSLGGTVTIDALPSQTGQAGRYLTTNGTTASWAVVNLTAVNDNLILQLMGAY